MAAGWSVIRSPVEKTAAAGERCHSPMLTRCASILACCVCCVAAAPCPAQPDYWPTAGWRVSAPEEQGVDSAQLAATMDFLTGKGPLLHSLLVIRHGYVILDAYFHPFRSDALHDVASVTKSVTSTLVGIALDKGLLDGVQQTVLPLFPDRPVANRDARKEAMTLENLLTMTGGNECVNSPTEVTLTQMMSSPDWIQFMLDLPMTGEPGGRFEYSSGGVHLLSAIVRRATGKTALAFAQEHLFGPLGIDGVVWPMDPRGLDNHGWGDLKMRPHDMAKLGFLFLHKGQWDGQEVVSAEWVRAATAQHVATGSEEYSQYGYLWWLREPGGFSAVGRGYQRIFVMPEQDLVVVVTAATGGLAKGKLRELLPGYLLPALRSNTPLPPNPDAVARLEARVQEAAEASPEPEPVPPLPELAKRISGISYKLDPNPIALSRVLFRFDEDKPEAVFELTQGGGAAGGETVAFAVGLDNVYRFSPGRAGLPAAAKGTWKGEDRFLLDLDEIGNINRWRIQFTFEGDRLTARMWERNGLGEVRVTGKQTRQPE